MQETSPRIYTFGEFVLDLTTGRLLRGVDEVKLRPKAFETLRYLVENPNRLISKDELVAALWTDSFVTDNSLVKCLKDVRLALNDEEHLIIKTVPKRGYIFVPTVSDGRRSDASSTFSEHVEGIRIVIEDVEQAESTVTAKSDIQFDTLRFAGAVRTGDDVSAVATPMTLPQERAVSDAIGLRRLSRKWLLIIPLACLGFTAVWIVRGRLVPVNTIKSLAVLPLKSLDASDDYLGAGIADAVIRRISQTGQLTVRPTSAVLRFRNQETESLAAARQLNADAVLEGSVQRAGDRLRIGVNLLRTDDGASLWAESFDVPAADLFVVQDKVAQEVATRLRLHLDSAQPGVSNSNYPTYPIAYEYYIKGIFSLDERGYGEEGKPKMETTIDYFRKAIEADPGYALAHAQLAFAYVWTALFIEPQNPQWVDLARKEIKRSQELGPSLGETHLANALLLWSAYEGYENDAAIRELLLARDLNPNCSHGELAAVYGHIGLDDLASGELQRELEIDPTSQSLKDLTMILPSLAVKPDEWLSARQKYVSVLAHVAPWYYLRKGLLDDAQKSIDERLSVSSSYDLLMQQALLLALKREFHEAEARVPAIMAKIQLTDQSRHHSTYDAACIYALAGKSSEAVKWLKETASTGFPNYPLFERDPYLDRIRAAPEFVQFMADQKAHWEADRQEFAQ